MRSPKNIKVLFVGSILPMEIVDLLGLSIAGKKYQLSLTAALDTVLAGNLDVISFSRQGRREAKQAGLTEVFEGKEYRQTLSLNFPVISDFVGSIHFFLMLLGWCFANRRYKRTVVIMNSPLGICLAALIMKYTLGVRPVSITMDTPFTGENNFDGPVGAYNRLRFSLGHRALKWFSGILVLNRNAVEALRLDIPFIVTKVGYTESMCTQKDRGVLAGAPTEEHKRVVYAGTLTPNKGILTLLEAFRRLESERYELHICGFGPLEDDVRRCAHECKAIHFHGCVEDRELRSLLSGSNTLLVNPTLSSDPADSFSFPSKLVEYILSGNPVLTTKFKSLPDEYLPFVHLITDETPEGFREAIRRVFSQDPKRIEAMCKAGIEYVRNHNDWLRISKDMVAFLETL